MPVIKGETVAKVLGIDRCYTIHYIFYIKKCDKFKVFFLTVYDLHIAIFDIPIWVRFFFYASNKKGNSFHDMEPDVTQLSVLFIKKKLINLNKDFLKIVLIQIIFDSQLLSENTFAGKPKVK